MSEIISWVIRPGALAEMKETNSQFVFTAGFGEDTMISERLEMLMGGTVSNI
jgi:hypothetical protein